MKTSRFRHRLPFGAEVNADGTALFRLWAPAASAVAVVFPDDREVAMATEAGGWFAVTTEAPAGSRYRFRIGPDVVVPDPAARAQHGDVGGWSVVVDAQTFEWQHGAWQGRPWHESVLYELHPGVLGGFRGVMNELPRLAKLGITAVELMPVADFAGTRNWGYDGVLPYAPDEAYGSPEDLKALVDAAHGLGLMVFLDVVYNHFGPEGNWLHAYAPSFFASDHTTPWGAAIDFSKPPVRDFFIENAIHWIMEYRFDGLRFDAVHAIESAPGEAFLQEMAERIRAAVEPGRDVHLVLEHDENAASHLRAHLYDAQWNDDGHHCLHVLLTGEQDGYYGDYARAPAALLARCLSQGFAYQGEPSAHRDGAPRGEHSAHLPPTAFVLFSQNHDQTGNRAMGDRLSVLAPAAALDAARALLLICPQVPMLFMGEEWASRRPFLYFTDFTGALADAVREGRAREFARFAAFAGDAAGAAIPDPNDTATFEASRLDASELDEPVHAAAHAHTVALLALRHQHIVPRLRNATSLAAEAIGPSAVRAAWRMQDGSTLRVLCNLGAEPVAVGREAETALHATPPHAPKALAEGMLEGFSTVWFLHDAATR